MHEQTSGTLPSFPLFIYLISNSYSSTQEKKKKKTKKKQKKTKKTHAHRNYNKTIYTALKCSSEHIRTSMCDCRRTLTRNTQFSDHHFWRKEIPEFFSRPFSNMAHFQTQDKVWPSSIRWPLCEWRKRENVQRVGQNLQTCLCRLWAKLHQILRNCKQPFVVYLSLFHCSFPHKDIDA